MQKSYKENKLEDGILSKLSGKSKQIASLIFNDREIITLQNHSNIVSIKRLGYNDHGPVHMKKTALNAMIMFGLLKNKNIKFNLEKEELGNSEDSRISILLASLLHDIGMSIGRDNHEFLSVNLSIPIITRLLKKIYPKNIEKRTVIRSTVIEGIIGHMANRTITSIEAGLVIIADGCDLEKGRARIPSLLSNEAKAGDIHRFSAQTITKLEIDEGKNKPIRINVHMKESAGLFQVEKVLLPKIKFSTIKPFIELYATINNSKKRNYL
ncbi:MAG: phosphohydrolase [Candidatus Mcinerneyibacterium aminivorans]|uniref:Phosphohydrolase n=1 Tax=Candidatus Mcinerneyibacterium aminivorans TaxID=2703815 RepID=A0A5D0MFF2_9BACT|nr:MAG: phosphohydrolase [Candidatus Mcinerneyibacterium aminivorans]